MIRCFFALVVLFAAFSPLRAEDRMPTNLLAGDGLAAFKDPGAGWAFADSVQVDEKNPRKLTFVPGKGILINGTKGSAPDLVTRESFGDIELHVEFFIPKGSNSGVKFHAHYEIQICDSFGKQKVEGDDCGGIYPRAELKPKYMHIDKGIAPKVNACKAPGEWQTLDVTFLAPRFDADGKKTAHAKIVKATLNGQIIHENQELETPTGHNYKNKEMAAGPLFFQGDHGPVAFRNVLVKQLKK